MTRVQVKAWAAASVMFVGVIAGSPSSVVAQDACDALSCEELCKAEKKACSALRLTLRDWLRAFCEDDATDAQFDCIDAKTIADEECGPLCGDDFKDCKDASKAALRECEEDVATIVALCKDDMRAELKEARDSCFDELDACKAECLAP